LSLACATVRLPPADPRAPGEATNLLWEDMRAEILQWQLELLRLPTKQELHHDGRLQRHGYIGRHSGRVRLTDVIGRRVKTRATDSCTLAAAMVNERCRSWRGRCRDVEGVLMGMLRRCRKGGGGRMAAALRRRGANAPASCTSPHLARLPIHFRERQQRRRQLPGGEEYPRSLKALYLLSLQTERYGQCSSYTW
jgi:hypothetical protein